MDEHTRIFILFGGIALQVSYREQVKKVFKNDYTEQGELFEHLTAECLAKLGWHVHATGWSRAQVKSMKDKVAEIAEHVGEPMLEAAIAKWTKASAKDAGLDVVCVQPFIDGWGGRPLCLVQCNSPECRLGCQVAYAEPDEVEQVN